jgi:hypothetical protein
MMNVAIEWQSLPHRLHRKMRTFSGIESFHKSLPSEKYQLDNEISIIQYADETILMFEYDVESVRNFKFILLYL